MKRLQQLMCAAVLGWAIAPSQAHADPPGPGKGDAKDERKQAKDARKEARADLKDARKDARADQKDARKEARDEHKDARKDAKDDLKDARKEAHDERKEMMRDAREERKDARDEHRDAHRAGHGDGDDDDDRGLKRGHRKHPGGKWVPSPEFLENMKKRRESRKERRDEHRKKYEKKWGEFARGKPAINEFRLHGWRMAKLRRIRLLAEAMDKDKLVAKVDALIEKEEARHDKALERLKTSGGEGAKTTPGNAQGPKPAKLDKPAPKPKPALPAPAKAAKEAE